MLQIHLDNLLSYFFEILRMNYFTKFYFLCSVEAIANIHLKLNLDLQPNYQKGMLATNDSCLHF